MEAARRLLREWGDEEAAMLLDDAVAEAIDEWVHAGERRWSALEARESVSYAIRSRITPVRPALRSTRGGRVSAPDSAGIGGADGWAQMPRFASNWAPSSRLFIWVRKRAASAPSTMR